MATPRLDLPAGTSPPPPDGLGAAAATVPPFHLPSLCNADRCFFVLLALAHLVLMVGSHVVVENYVGSLLEREVKLNREELDVFHQDALAHRDVTQERFVKFQTQVQTSLAELHGELKALAERAPPK
jgi:hypothetical protein